MQTISRKGAIPTVPGPDGIFTGNVTVEMLFTAVEGSNVTGALVTFEPGARTSWHTHPMGQNLIVVSGTGWTQCEGGPKKEIRAGDTVSCACGLRHWHGATSISAMSHIAITEALDGTAVNWLAVVNDAEYLAPIEED